MKPLIVAFNLVVILSWSGLGQCQAQQVPNRPAVQHTMLDNGLRVLFQPNAHSSTVAICATIEVRASQESRLTAGIRHLLSLIASQPGPKSESLGPWPAGLHIESTTSRDYVELLVQCLPDNFPFAMRLIRRQLFELAIDREQFKAARREALTTIQATRRLPVALAASKIVEELYPQQAGSWPAEGRIASMSAISLSQVREFHQNNFWPNVTVLSISGDLEAADVKAQARSCFGDLLPGQTGHISQVFSPHPAAQAPRRLIMKGVDTSVVVVGGRAPGLADPEYAAAAVLSAMLGSGMGSRLFQTLRAQRALAYTVRAALTPSQVSSHIYVLVTCALSNVETVQAEITDQLEKIIQEGISDSELERAKQFIINRFTVSQQRNRDIAHYPGVFYASAGQEGLRMYQQFTTQVTDVSAAQVQQCCAEVFAAPVTVIVEGMKCSDGKI